MKKIALLVTLLAGCSPVQTWGFGYGAPSAPREDLAEYRDTTAPELTKEEQDERECLVLIDQYYQDLETYQAARSGIPPVTDEEREEFARQQGEARQDDVCFMHLRRDRQGATFVQVPCGRPARDYRESSAFAAGVAPTMPQHCVQYDTRAYEEALQAYKEMTGHDAR